MKVVSIGGIANDEVNYYMSLEFPFSQPSLRLEHTRREGGDPLVTRARREALVMNLGILIPGYDEGTTKTRREALLAALDTDAAAIPLIVEDDDGGDDRYRYVVVQGVDEQRGEEGPGQYLVATLVTHGETRWRANTLSSTTWNATASGDTTVIANGGALPARPVYTIEPTNSKAAPGNAFAYRAFCAVRWDGRTAAQYPVNITGSVWDTDALLTASKIYAAYGENNIAVMADGAMTRRWITDYDDTITSVWVNLDWIYCPNTYLLTGFGSGDSVTEIAADGDIGAFPFSGLLQIGTELFAYTGRDVATGTFSGVTRAARESTAANHSGGTSGTGDEIHLIQHDIWLLYGGSGYWLNTYDLSRPDGFAGSADEDTYKPVIDLTQSGNGIWTYDYFGQTTAPRTVGWRIGGAPTGTGTVGDPFDEIVLTNNSSLVAQAGESFWAIPTAHNLLAARIIGRAANYEPGTIWQVGLYAGGGVYVNVPQPEYGGSEFDLVDFDLETVETRYAEDARFYQRCGGAMEARLDVATLHWVDPPQAAMMDEVALYDMALTLENVTTGQSITLTLAMALGEQLEIDTANHTVTLLDDSSSQYQALARSTRRREILMLAPGNNTLRVTEDGLDGVTVYVEFEERSYS